MGSRLSTPAHSARPFAREQLWHVVDSSSAAATLADYFRPEAGADAVLWTGGWFERLAGGGDRAQAANSITADDLVAVTVLGVQVPAAVCVHLLHGPLGEALASLLGSIPVDVSLENAEAELLRAGSSADEAWHMLTEQHGVDWVIAGKLLARKAAAPRAGVRQRSAVCARYARLVLGATPPGAAA